MSRAQPRDDFFIILCLLVIGAICAMNAIQNWNADVQLRQVAIQTQASIVDHWIEDSSIGQWYHVIYRFEALGKQITTQEKVNKELYEGLGTRSTVTVRYLPQNPVVSKVVGNEYSDPWAGLALFFLFGAGLIFFLHIVLGRLFFPE